MSIDQERKKPQIMVNNSQCDHKQGHQKQSQGYRRWNRNNTNKSQT